MEKKDNKTIKSNGQGATHFTERIITSCKYIFKIRPKDNPELIIGDCALHHWNQQKREIEIGGSLLPKYWGKGYMQAAFELLIIIAKKELRVEALLGQTKTSNIKAIRFFEKMGFVKHQIDGQATSALFGVKLYTKWYLNSKNQIEYDSIEFFSDGYFNNAFVGIWGSYSNGNSKICNWDDYRVPNANKDFDIGVGEFNVSEKYWNKGWLDIALKNQAPNHAIKRSKWSQLPTAFSFTNAD